MNAHLPNPWQLFEKIEWEEQVYEVRSCIVIKQFPGRQRDNASSNPALPQQFPGFQGNVYLGAGADENYLRR